MMLRPILTALLYVLSYPCALMAGAGPSNNPGTPWPGTDALGRELPLAETAGEPKTNRFVGIFYFLWQSTEVRAGDTNGEPYNVAKILAQDPDALKKPQSKLWGPVGVYHYWAEPLLGYYSNRDPWVLRRHARWLADAGVDALIFDTTNAQTYRDTYLALCDAFAQIRAEGGRTPQICFMVHTSAGDTAEKLFREFYEPGRQRDLWFEWQGRPLLLCNPAEVKPAWKDFFTLRRAHWPFHLTNTPYAWHWEATYPQPYGYTDDPAAPEMVNVSVAQNLRQDNGHVTNMSDGNARGRSFHNGAQDSSPGAVLGGLNFQEQWKRAFDLDTPFVMVTGWNEWIAGRWGKPEGPILFVDQYDQEFSRDIEPMRGGHGDNYYMQLIANVRRYKGVPRLPQASGPITINLQEGFEQWDAVKPVFADGVGDASPRSHPGVLRLNYRDLSGRNDVEYCHVARDGQFAYFHVQTREPLASPQDASWMWLLVDVQKPQRKARSQGQSSAEEKAASRWGGFQFIINRSMAGKDQAWIERSTGGWAWQRVTRVKYRAEGRHLHLAVPLSALGIKDSGRGFQLDFKWLDNATQPPDELSFYTRGDAAPDGRLRYRYIAPPE